MSESKMEQSLVKGVLAGVVAGLIATVAKSIAEKMYAPQEAGETERPYRAEDGSLRYQREESGVSKNILTSVDWKFGIAAGAAYGALAEFYPAASTDGGKTFGSALMTLTHRNGLPGGEFAAVGGQHTGDGSSNMLFGTVTEQVRHFVRRML